MSRITGVIALGLIAALASSVPVAGQYYPRWDPQQGRVIHEPIPNPPQRKPPPLTRKERCELMARGAGPLYQERLWDCMRNTHD